MRSQGRSRRTIQQNAEPEMAKRYVGGALLKVLHEAGADFTFRQRLIEKIQKQRRRRLVTYVSNVEHPAVQIDLNDAHNLETCFRAPSDWMRLSRGNPAVG